MIEYNWQNNSYIMLLQNGVSESTRATWHVSTLLVSPNKHTGWIHERRITILLSADGFESHIKSANILIDI